MTVTASATVIIITAASTTVNMITTAPTAAIIIITTASTTVTIANDSRGPWKARSRLVHPCATPAQKVTLL